MEESLLAAAKSPFGGAAVIVELVKRNPKVVGQALAVVGQEVLTLMSQSPSDLADLFEWVDKDVRIILYIEMPDEALANMARSPSDWRRIQASIEED